MHIDLRITDIINPISAGVDFCPKLYKWLENTIKSYLNEVQRAH